MQQTACSRRSRQGRSVLSSSTCPAMVISTCKHMTPTSPGNCRISNILPMPLRRLRKNCHRSYSFYSCGPVRKYKVPHWPFCMTYILKIWRNIMTKIIFCEDEARIQKLILTTLRSSLHEIYIASDGVEGLALIEKERPDLIFTDISM